MTPIPKVHLECCLRLKVEMCMQKTVRLDVEGDIKQSSWSLKCSRFFFPITIIVHGTESRNFKFLISVLCVRKLLTKADSSDSQARVNSNGQLKVTTSRVGTPPTPDPLIPTNAHPMELLCVPQTTARLFWRRLTPIEIRTRDKLYSDPIARKAETLEQSGDPGGLSKEVAGWWRGGQGRKKRVQANRECIGVSVDVLVCPWMYWCVSVDVWVCTWMYGCARRCMGVSVDVWVCPWMYGCARGCSGVPVDVWVCPWMYGCVRGCMGVPVDVLVCPWMYGCARGCMGVSVDVLVCPWMYGCGRGCLGVPMDLQVCRGGRGVSVDVLVCPCMYGCVRGCTGVSVDVLVCPWMYGCVRRCMGVSVDVWVCPWMYWCVRGCMGVPVDVVVCRGGMGVSVDVLVCPCMYGCVRGCTGVSVDVLV
ncbi:hypothetical protein Btru_070897 [Bulinus truncatus]|nr:hypothetical protein Btru_070897 [Bulinus truncatus]